MAGLEPLTTAFLLVETTRRGQPVWAAKWRTSDGTRVKRRLGAPAWMELEGGRWRPRPGRPAPGHLTERQARRLLPAVVEAGEAEAVERRARAEREAAAARRAECPTFRKLAHTWLAYLADVDDVKPSTLRNYGFMLAEPGRPHRRGTGTARGRIMEALGERDPSEITTADVVAMLDTIAADRVRGRRGDEESAPPVSRRTVNRHREVVVAIFNFALRPEQRHRWGVKENPAAGAPKRREDEPVRLEVFTVEQVEALARAADSGAWRTPREYEAPNARTALEAQDRQLGELIRVAAYTGLRRGEIIALRWRDVRWGERVLVVERALSDTVERTTKGRRVRYVPLADQALAALDRLSKREHFLAPDDYVFCSAVGERLDPSALRRRYVAARDAASVPPLRFHDLRHTAGTLLTRVLDPVTVKDVLGHADLKTTERYLHAIRASRLADAATRAFTASPVKDASDTAQAALQAAIDRLESEEVRRRLGMA